MLTYRFLLPLVFGAAATGANYVALERATATSYLVAVRNDVKAGEPIAEKDLYRVAVRGDKALFNGAIPYEKRESLYGQRPRRKLTAGELVLRPDIEHANWVISTDIPAGYESFTIHAKRSTIAMRPVGGQHVALIVKRVGNATTQKYGPYLFLGWVAGSDHTGKDSDVIHLAIAVPQQRDTRVEELRAFQATGSADWLIQLETTAPPAASKK